MFASRHHIWAKIEDRFRFIQYLINIFPSLEKSHEDEIMKICADTANRQAEGDKEIELSISKQFSEIYYNSQDNKNIFYQAMLTIVYSYYETSINLIDKELGDVKHIKGQDTLSSIITSRGVYLPEHINTAKQFIYKNVRAIRNFIIHNNSVAPTKEQSDAIKILTEQYPEILYIDNEVSITGCKCILEFLMQEYSVLKYLCIALGYYKI